MDTTDKYQERFNRIIELLEQHASTGLTITAVAQNLAIPRNSASKYLALLASKGDVSVEQFGQKKFYRPLPRVPVLDIFDRLPYAIVILDADLQVRMVNMSFVTELGILPGRNIIGTPLFDLNLPIFGEPMVRRNIERIRQSQTYIADLDLIKESTDRIYHVEFSPVVMQFGRPGIMVSLRDITERLKTETELKDSKRKMATLFETVPNGIVMFAVDGSILDANPASLQILGLQTFEELSAANAFDLSCAPGRLESLIRRGRTDDTELACDFDRMKRDQGIPTTKSGVAFLNVVFTPIHPDSGGPPTEFAILFKDITRDRRERKELAVRETRYHSFFEDSVNGVLIYEPIDGGPVYVFKDLNRTAEEILGVPKADLIGRNPVEVFPDIAFAELQESVERVMATGKPEFLPPFQYKRGRDKWIWHYLFKLSSNELAALMFDVSEELRGEGGWPPATDVSRSLGRDSAHPGQDRDS
jgi:PAS domain S-box-containing protein